MSEVKATSSSPAWSAQLCGERSGPTCICSNRPARRVPVRDGSWIQRIYMLMLFANLYLLQVACLHGQIHPTANTNHNCIHDLLHAAASLALQELLKHFRIRRVAASAYPVLV